MARTKKEQIPEENMELELQASQTDLEMSPESSLPDFELQATDTLDPDAPQTDAEIEAEADPTLEPSEDDTGFGQSDDGVLQASQTGSESNDQTEDAACEGEESFESPQIPQTDMEFEPEAGIPAQTESEMTGDELSAGQSDWEDPQSSQTEPETGLDPESPQTDPDPAADDAAPHARRRRRSRTETEQASDDPAEAEEGADTDSEQPKKLRMPGRRRQRVVSIDAERTVETDTDRLRSDLLDLVESLKGKKILTGTIQGVERLADNPEMSYAVLYHGDFKVIIPVLEAIEEPEDYRDQSKGDVLHYLLNKRLGAEVDYIVKGVDQDSNVVAASRLEAMALKRREYYFRTDRDGNYQIYEGIRAEARVVSVIRAGIFVDLFGAECYIPLRELSYQRWVDAAAHYQPGQRVLVKVLSVDRSDRNRPRVSASVKQASENPYEKALKKYVVGNRYVGTVSMVDLNGVFVSLDGGIDCLCTYPRRGRPPRGARATVRILGINQENNRIWGVITHMSTTR